MFRIPIILISLLMISVTSYAADFSSWNLYTSAPQSHSYTLRYPTNWHITESGQFRITLAPQDEHTAITLELFQLDLPDVISYLQENYGEYQSKNNYLLNTTSEDLIYTELVYETTKVRLFKRGDYVFSFTQNSDIYPDTYDTIIDSLDFTDNWHAYIDFKDNYTFIFPQNYDLKSISEGVAILNQDKTVFSVTYTDKELDPENLLNFHGYAASVVIPNKSLLIQNDNQNYLLSFQASETVQQMLDSFELFQEDHIDQEYSPFLIFPDVRNNHPNALAINNLAKKRVIQGYDEGTFKPDNSINRAELTKIVVASKIRPDSDKYNNCFPDVTDQWFAPYVCYAKKQNWVSGYADGTFKPDQQINRVEALKIILESLITTDLPEYKNQSLPKDIDPESWYIDYFSYAQSENLLDLYHQIDQQYFPGAPITRKEVAETVYRITIK